MFDIFSLLPVHGHSHTFDHTKETHFKFSVRTPTSAWVVVASGTNAKDVLHAGKKILAKHAEVPLLASLERLVFDHEAHDYYGEFSWLSESIAF